MKLEVDAPSLLQTLLYGISQARTHRPDKININMAAGAFLQSRKNFMMGSIYSVLEQC